METGIVIGSVMDFDKVVTEVDFEMDENLVHYDWNWMGETSTQNFDRDGTSTQKCVLCKIDVKLVCANVPSILPL